MKSRIPKPRIAKGPCPLDTVSFQTQPILRTANVAPSHCPRPQHIPVSSPERDPSWFPLTRTALQLALLLESSPSPMHPKLSISEPQILDLESQQRSLTCTPSFATPQTVKKKKKKTFRSLYFQRQFELWSLSMAPAVYMNLNFEF